MTPLTALDRCAAALARSHTLSRRVMLRACARAYRRDADLWRVSPVLSEIHLSRPNSRELVADLRSRLRSLLRQRRQRDVEARLFNVSVAYLAEATRLREARRFQQAAE